MCPSQFRRKHASKRMPRKELPEEARGFEELNRLEYEKGDASLFLYGSPPPAIRLTSLLKTPSLSGTSPGLDP
jgi:hypothetical protein